MGESSNEKIECQDARGVRIQDDKKKMETQRKVNVTWIFC